MGSREQSKAEVIYHVMRVHVNNRKSYVTFKTFWFAAACVFTVAFFISVFRLTSVFYLLFKMENVLNIKHHCPGKSLTQTQILDYVCYGK